MRSVEQNMLEYLLTHMPLFFNKRRREEGSNLNIPNLETNQGATNQEAAKS